MVFFFFLRQKSSEDSVRADAVIYSETSVVRVRGSAFDWDSDMWMPPVKERAGSFWYFGYAGCVWTLDSGNEEEGGTG